jgi:hypothetical protein
LPAQRQRTANELNTAILESTSQNKEAKLVGLIRLLVWGETMLQERADFPKVRALIIYPQRFAFRARGLGCCKVA